jgi:hypothetical protein
MAQCLPKSAHLHTTNVAMTHCLRGSFKLLLPSRSRTMSFHWHSFCLWFKEKDPCFIPSDDPLQKPFSQPCNGTANQHKPLSAKFCDILSFIEPNKHKYLNSLSHQQCSWHFLWTVTAQLQASLSPAWPFLEPATGSPMTESAFINSNDTTSTF